MRSRTTLTLLLAVSSLALPLAAHAGGIPFFGPIIPSANANCPGGLALLLTVVNNLISFMLTLAIVFVAPIMIAWSGFLFVVNPVNPAGKEDAKKILWNTVLGIIIALAGWMIVDALMAVLYNGSFGTWASIVSGGDFCLNQAGAAPGSGLNQTQPSSVNTSSPGNSNSGLSTTLSTSPGSPCNPDTITSAAQSAGYSISSAQAQQLACVAQGESTCGTTNPPYNLNSSWNKPTSSGSASTAAGAYQVLLSTNSTCYNNSVCEQAGGTPGVPLNCSSGFSPGGFPIAGSPVVTTCEQAAGNVNCSAAAAACLLRSQSFSAAYATDPYTSSCLNAYPG